MVHNWAWILLVGFCVVGLIYPIIGAVAIICMLSPVVVAFFRGRLWCGNFCPRGSFNDIILSKISLENKMPNFMKTKWFKLLFLVILMSAFIIQLALSGGNAVVIGIIFVRMIVITTILTIALGIVYHHRAWCTICPMGTMAHYVSRLKISKNNAKHVSFVADDCVNCRLCTKSCPMSIDVLSHKNNSKVLDGDCLKCNICVEKCPKKALDIA
jgi:polyferredoxin